MNNKGTNWISRLEISLVLLRFVWLKKNVVMIDVLLSKEKEWEHHIISSNLLTISISRYKEIAKSFKKSLEVIFWSEVKN